MIETYELYPTTRYGIDGVVFWYHLLAKAPDSLRVEFESQCAFAQGLLLASFSAAIVGALYGIMLVGVGIGVVFPSLIVGSPPLPWPLLMTFLVAALLLAILFYRLSIPAHRETGRVFRALVDLSAGDVVKWLETAPTQLDAAPQERSRKVRQFLRSQLRSDQ